MPIRAIVLGCLQTWAFISAWLYFQLTSGRFSLPLKAKNPAILVLKMTVCILQWVSAAVGGFSGKFSCHRITQGPDYYQMVCDKQTQKLILLKYSLQLVLKCTRSGLWKA